MEKPANLKLIHDKSWTIVRHDLRLLLETKNDFFFIINL